MYKFRDLGLAEGVTNRNLKLDVQNWLKYIILLALNQNVFAYIILREIIKIINALFENLNTKSKQICISRSVE